jgi:hypothetical protein
MWQQHTAGQIAEAVAKAPWAPVPIDLRPGDGGLYAVPESPLPELEGAEALPRMTVPFAYLAAEFEDGNTPFCMVVCYGDATGRVNHTERIWHWGDANGGILRYYFPVYRWTVAVPPEEGFYSNITPEFRRNHFLGLWAPEPFKDRFRGLLRVTQPGELRFLPYLALPEQGNPPPLRKHFGDVPPAHPCGYPQHLPPAIE